jgi:hypothetical protein
MDNLGFDEVVDTAVDILESAETLASALKDGFQFTDIPALISVAPKAQEIAKDGRTAINQLLDLSPEEAEEAAKQIALRTGKHPSGITVKVNEGFTLIARTYRTIKGGILLTQDWQRFAKTIA